jgi:hypothetical protein
LLGEALDELDEFVVRSLELLEYPAGLRSVVEEVENGSRKRGRRVL